MASSRSGRSGTSPEKKRMRFVNSKSLRRSAVKKKTDRTASSRKIVGSRVAADSKTTNKNPKDAIPGWKDLTTSNDKKRSPHDEAEAYISTLSTTRFAVMLLSMATLFTLYVGHIYSTQELLSNVKELRRENQNLGLHLNEVQGLYAAVTGPEIFIRARGLGLEPRLPEKDKIILD